MSVENAGGAQKVSELLQEENQSVIKKSGE